MASSHNCASSSGVCCEANVACTEYTMQQAIIAKQARFSRIPVSSRYCLALGRNGRLAPNQRTFELLLALRAPEGRTPVLVKTPYHSAAARGLALLPLAV